MKTSHDTHTVQCFAVTVVSVKQGRTSSIGADGDGFISWNRKKSIKKEGSSVSFLPPGSECENNYPKLRKISQQINQNQGLQSKYPPTVGFIVLFFNFKGNRSILYLLVFTIISWIKKIKNVVISSYFFSSSKSTAYMDNISSFFLIAEHLFTWDKIVLSKKVHFGPKNLI